MTVLEINNSDKEPLMSSRSHLLRAGAGSRLPLIIVLALGVVCVYSLAKLYSAGNLREQLQNDVYSIDRSLQAALEQKKDAEVELEQLKRTYVRTAEDLSKQQSAETKLREELNIAQQVSEQHQRDVERLEQNAEEAQRTYDELQETLQNLSTKLDEATNLAKTAQYKEQQCTAGLQDTERRLQQQEQLVAQLQQQRQPQPPQGVEQLKPTAPAAAPLQNDATYNLTPAVGIHKDPPLDNDSGNALLNQGDRGGLNSLSNFAQNGGYTVNLQQPMNNSNHIVAAEDNVGIAPPIAPALQPAQDNDPVDFDAQEDSLTQKPMEGIVSKQGELGETETDKPDLFGLNEEGGDSGVVEETATLAKDRDSANEVLGEDKNAANEVMEYEDINVADQEQNKKKGGSDNNDDNHAKENL